MANKGGLGKGLNEIFAEQDAAEDARLASGRSDGLDLLIPGANQKRTFHISRPSRSGDPDFGTGYDVIDTAHSRNPLGRPRAQKIGYNSALQYLAILMRDGKMVGYPGVTQGEWDDYQNYSSTTDYIEIVLGRYNGIWDDLGTTQPPQTREDLFKQGTED